MNYISTRNKEVEVSASEAIIKGIAPDGGLFVPEELPLLSLDKISALSNLTYNEKAEELLKLFLSDFSADEIKECVNMAYNKENFETESIAPLYKLDRNEYILELWYGPTCAFKDMALQILPYLLTTSIKKTGENREIVILVATSGDTGKAALEGFKNVEGTRIIVFYPDNGVSKIQELQMITQEGQNVDVVAVKGNFDDAQSAVKDVFTDKEFNMKLNDNQYKFSSANSINWGRLVPQIIYYFASYADLLKNEEIKPGEKINIVVPTGNFGNILAAYYAMNMGLPVNKLICASNENNVLTEFINSGIYNKNRSFKTTISPSMDILISSNLERLLFEITAHDSARVKAWMKELDENGQYEVADVTKQKLNKIFYADYCDDKVTIDTIKKTYEDHSYVIDTHTAVGKAVYDKYLNDTKDETKTVIASTASPFKFNESVLSAILGKEEIEGKDEFELLEQLSQISGAKIPKSLLELKDNDILHKTKCNKNDIKQTVSNILNLS